MIYWNDFTCSQNSYLQPVHLESCESSDSAATSRGNTTYGGEIRSKCIVVLL